MQINKNNENNKGSQSKTDAPASGTQSQSDVDSQYAAGDQVHQGNDGWDIFETSSTPTGDLEIIFDKINTKIEKEAANLKARGMQLSTKFISHNSNTNNIANLALDTLCMVITANNVTTVYAWQTTDALNQMQLPPGEESVYPGLTRDSNYERVLRAELGLTDNTKAIIFNPRTLRGGENLDQEIKYASSIMFNDQYNAQPLRCSDLKNKPLRVAPTFITDKAPVIHDGLLLPSCIKVVMPQMFNAAESQDKMNVNTPSRGTTDPLTFYLMLSPTIGLNTAINPFSTEVTIIGIDNPISLERVFLTVQAVLAMLDKSMLKYHYTKEMIESLLKLQPCTDQNNNPVQADNYAYDKIFNDQIFVNILQTSGSLLDITAEALRGNTEDADRYITERLAQYLNMPVPHGFIDKSVKVPVGTYRDPDQNVDRSLLELTDMLSIFDSFQSTETVSHFTRLMTGTSGSSQYTFNELWHTYDILGPTLHDSAHLLSISPVHLQLLAEGLDRNGVSLPVEVMNEMRKQSVMGARSNGFSMDGMPRQTHYRPGDNERNHGQQRTITRYRSR